MPVTDDKNMALPSGNALSSPAESATSQRQIARPLYGSSECIQPEYFLPAENQRCAIDLYHRQLVLEEIKQQYLQHTAAAATARYARTFPGSAVASTYPSFPSSSSHHIVSSSAVAVPTPLGHLAPKPAMWKDASLAAAAAATQVKPENAGDSTEAPLDLSTRSSRRTPDSTEDDDVIVLEETKPGEKLSSKQKEDSRPSSTNILKRALTGHDCRPYMLQPVNQTKELYSPTAAQSLHMPVSDQSEMFKSNINAYEQQKKRGRTPSVYELLEMQRKQTSKRGSHLHSLLRQQKPDCHTSERTPVICHAEQEHQRVTHPSKNGTDVPLQSGRSVLTKQEPSSLGKYCYSASLLPQSSQSPLTIAPPNANDPQISLADRRYMLNPDYFKLYALYPNHVSVGMQGQDDQHQAKRTKYATSDLDKTNHSKSMTNSAYEQSPNMASHVRDTIKHHYAYKAPLPEQQQVSQSRLGEEPDRRAFLIREQEARLREYEWTLLKQKAASLSAQVPRTVEQSFLQTANWKTHGIGVRGPSLSRDIITERSPSTDAARFVLPSGSSTPGFMHVFPDKSTCSSFVVPSKDRSQMRTPHTSQQSTSHNVRKVPNNLNQGAKAEGSVVKAQLNHIGSYISQESLNAVQNKPVSVSEPGQVDSNQKNVTSTVLNDSCAPSTKTLLTNAANVTAHDYETMTPLCGKESLSASAMPGIHPLSSTRYESLKTRPILESQQECVRQPEQTKMPDVKDRSYFKSYLNALKHSNYNLMSPKNDKTQTVLHPHSNSEQCALGLDQQVNCTLAPIPKSSLQPKSSSNTVSSNTAASTSRTDSPLSQDLCRKEKRESQSPHLRVIPSTVDYPTQLPGSFQLLSAECVSRKIEKILAEKAEAERGSLFTNVCNPTGNALSSEGIDMKAESRKIPCAAKFKPAKSTNQQEGRKDEQKSSKSPTNTKDSVLIRLQQRLRAAKYHETKDSRDEVKATGAHPTWVHGTHSSKMTQDSIKRSRESGDFVYSNNTLLPTDIPVVFTVPSSSASACSPASSSSVSYDRAMSLVSTTEATQNGADSSLETIADTPMFRCKKAWKKFKNTECDPRQPTNTLNDDVRSFTDHNPEPTRPHCFVKPEEVLRSATLSKPQLLPWPSNNALNSDANDGVLISECEQQYNGNNSAVTMNNSTPEISSTPGLVFDDVVRKVYRSNAVTFSDIQREGNVSGGVPTQNADAKLNGVTWSSIHIENGTGETKLRNFPPGKLGRAKAYMSENEHESEHAHKKGKRARIVALRQEKYGSPSPANMHDAEEASLPAKEDGTRLSADATDENQSAARFTDVRRNLAEFAYHFTDFLLNLKPLCCGVLAQL